MNRIIVITGANNGIGLAMTQSLLKTGDCVTALIRKQTTSIRLTQTPR